MSLKPQPLADGLLIVFEGIDGAGKTTQLELVRDKLQAEGWPVLPTRSLGGTPIGEALREVIKSPLERPAATNLYISAAIQEALINAIEADRAKGKLILMDRGPLSLAAYEIYGSRLDEALGWPHVEDGMSRLRPELTIIYTADVNTALKRAQGKSGQADYFESKPRDFFERVAEGYDIAAKRYAATTVIINASRPVEAILDETMRAVRGALAKKL